MSSTAKFASKIHEAAFNANLEDVRALLKEGASVEPGEDKASIAPIPATVTTAAVHRDTSVPARRLSNRLSSWQHATSATTMTG